jgi:hypothetical protein
MAELAQEICDFIATRTHDHHAIQQAVINVLADVAAAYPDHLRDRAVRGLQDDLARLTEEHVALRRATAEVEHPWGSA